MFSAHSDYMRANEKGEYEVAKGLSSSVFKIIMVRSEFDLLKVLKKLSFKDSIILFP